MVAELDPREVEFQAQLETLRRHFVDGLPERRAALAAAWRDCADGGDEAPWERLRDVAHKLSGSAPCYGLDRLGEVARGLDRQLSGRAPCRRRAPLAMSVAQLLAALEAAVASV
ncbi:MAG TPA: Hpt domain-containing protein [Rhodanobacteraceae bacterium]|jgi:HPt (histidine-containing phosphotransfer) domain-containing protein|nr:Hpt domain-containing protein [Rhodanobacteraceae bacterium]